jgi:hypothetical protein
MNVSSSFIIWHGKNHAMENPVHKDAMIGNKIVRVILETPFLKYEGVPFQDEKGAAKMRGQMILNGSIFQEKYQPLVFGLLPFMVNFNNMAPEEMVAYIDKIKEEIVSGYFSYIKENGDYVKMDFPWQQNVVDAAMNGATSLSCFPPFADWVNRIADKAFETSAGSYFNKDGEIEMKDLLVHNEGKTVDLTNAFSLSDLIKKYRSEFQKIKPVIITGSEPLRKNIADTVKKRMEEEYVEKAIPIPVPIRQLWIACNGTKDYLINDMLPFIAEIEKGHKNTLSKNYSSLCDAINNELELRSTKIERRAKVWAQYIKPSTEVKATRTTDTFLTAEIMNKINVVLWGEIHNVADAFTSILKNLAKNISDNNTYDSTYFNSYASSVKGLLKKLEEVDYEILQLLTTLLYEGLFNEKEKNSIAHASMLLCLINYLSQKRSGDMMVVLKKDMWHKFVSICKNLSVLKIEDRKKKKEYPPVIDYVEDVNKFYWRGLDKSLDIALGRFISRLRELNMFKGPQDDISDSQIVRAVLRFFNGKANDDEVVKLIVRHFNTIHENDDLWLPDIKLPS